jgi:hypothetical protein
LGDKYNALQPNGFSATGREQTEDLIDIYRQEIQESLAVCSVVYSGAEPPIGTRTATPIMTLSK